MSALVPSGALSDVEIRRWLRIGALHALFSSLALVTWCLPACLKSGLWSALLAPLSASFWAGFSLFLVAQLLFLASFRTVAEPEHSPGIEAQELLQLLTSSSLSVILGAPKEKVKQLDGGWRKLAISARRTVFLLLVAASGALSVLGVGLLRLGASQTDVRWAIQFGAGLGLLYAAQVLLSQHYVLRFPPIQRPWYQRLKLALRPAASLSLSVTTAALIFWELLNRVHPSSAARIGSFLERALLSAMVGTLTAFCWELGRSVARIILTERHYFTPPPGTISTETAPADALLTALRNPKPLARHLAFLDLCYVAERSVDKWRRAAFFRDETGTSYKKVIDLCLEPVEGVIEGAKLAVGGGNGRGGSGTRPGEFQLQMGAAARETKRRGGDPEEILRDLQICAWGARAASSLTAASRKEDSFGVAQLTSSNPRVVSTLLSALLAIETVQKAGLFFTRNGGFISGFLRPLVNPGASFSRVAYAPSAALALGDVIRVSLHVITEEFAGEMLVFRPGSGPVLDDRDWLPAGSPAFGTRAAHVEKLRAILDFRE
ncbi:hypothetical protein KFL_000140520 [Klebsormidium nitens]|uniref:Uncharacterized protein n=1 Tax=Klebsormidium nitens TaxID=105231 RepID=A0A1Y1HNG7_KLENI|nr:hypothetical protein KFL_000140520 [Klebsormidium nitens]|eukprot:GAQ78531.1 hypothetical protein KFL_000140520 [Klebsormidium nitens]